MGKDLHHPTSDRGWISQIYKELKKLDIEIPNDLVKKLGTDLNRSISNGSPS